MTSYRTAKRDYEYVIRQLIGKPGHWGVVVESEPIEEGRKTPHEIEAIAQRLKSRGIEVVRRWNADTKRCRLYAMAPLELAERKGLKVLERLEIIEWVDEVPAPKGSYTTLTPEDADPIVKLLHANPGKWAKVYEFDHPGVQREADARVWNIRRRLRRHGIKVRQKNDREAGVMRVYGRYSPED